MLGGLRWCAYENCKKENNSTQWRNPGLVTGS
jgi:hypothetical protein